MSGAHLWILPRRHAERRRSPWRDACCRIRTSRSAARSAGRSCGTSCTLSRRTSTSASRPPRCRSRHVPRGSPSFRPANIQRSYFGRVDCERWSRDNVTSAAPGGAVESDSTAADGAPILASGTIREQRCMNLGAWSRDLPTTVRGNASRLQRLRLGNQNLPVFDESPSTAFPGSRSAREQLPGVF